jgi:hypothetical protein
MKPEESSLLPSDKEGYTLISNEALLGNTFAISVLMNMLAERTEKPIETIEEEITIISNLQIFSMSKEQIKENIDKLTKQSMNKDKTNIGATKITLK